MPLLIPPSTADDALLPARAARLALRGARPRLRRMPRYSGMSGHFPAADAVPLEAAGT